jgi:predicted O-linked N-acetylglucosamine transferase (SPINDLY family)
MRQGSWLELEPIAERHKQLLKQLEKQPNFSLDPLTRSSWQGIASPLLYFQDNLAENRYYQNLVAGILENNLKNTLAKVEPSRLSFRRLKIGYLASTLKRHSVGWLSRWLIHYHNRNNFESILYIHQQTEDDITRKYFIPYADQVRYCTNNAQEIAAQIQADGINILVDLDSITNATYCQVIALKPAPIQVTWLGFDASGIPSIDYFIADNYVLPENASDYYREKIWRLPNTYLAVKGFEVGIPTLRRENLDIPGDGIIYMTVQSSYKRHPDTLRLQMKILREVPNSYLLIKGFADQKILQELFIQIATAEGVNPQRLRFLPDVAQEEIHRANLAIADVVLDTYPYNGATTTLEVLWMGIPLVTRVGEQFAARNSYTFMLNAGITEGIAWNEEEYLHWGIRFGREEDLRKRVQWQLKKSRQHAPLWDARKFTQEMEAAYTQMWEQLGDK